MNEELKAIAAKVRRLLAIDEHYDNGSITLMLSTDEANALRNAVCEAADALSRHAQAVQVPVGMALVPCDEATAASVWLTTCASNIEAGFSQWECDEMRRIAALLAAAPTPATVATEAVAQNARDAAFIDVVTHGQGFLQIGADGMETHIPAESVVHEAVAQGGGVDVEKVMALVEQYGQEKWSQGDNQYRRGCESSATYYSEEAGRIRDRIRALLASAPAAPVGDGLAFGDAVRIARGCTDYGGGYRHEAHLFEAYQSGIKTVIRSLEAAEKKGLADSQVRALHCMGSPAPAATKKG